MEILVIVAYAAILALVAPFVLPPSEHYGRLLPIGIAAVAGSAIWIVMTWLGFSYSEAWIWFAVMLGMPIAAWFGAKFVDAKRKASEDSELARLRSGGQA
ncbi:MAG: hypothetical protein VXA38_01910 [Aquiluna sp.]